MYFHQEELPVRLCYRGNTYINHSSYRGRLKESTQMGVELIGDSSVDADGEVIALAVELLKETGLTEFQISIGQVDFFKSLIQEAGLSEETTDNLKELISNKNLFWSGRAFEQSETFQTAGRCLFHASPAFWLFGCS